MFVYVWLGLLKLPEDRMIFSIWVEAYKVYLQKNSHMNIINQIRYVIIVKYEKSDKHDMYL